jgi:Uma2 family endonuclease
MSEVLEEIKNEFFDDKVSDMGSVIHSRTLGRLTVLIGCDERFEVMPELSLDVTQIDLKQFGLKAKDELKPDVCVYTTPPEAELPDDILKTTQMPDLAIEILSPSQTVSELINKLKAYFALNIKSCWLVKPSLTTITVYSQLRQYKTFDLNDTEVVDEVMDIHLPIEKVFKKSVIGNG